MEKTKESPSKYICSNPNVLPSCENRQVNRCHYKGLCYLKEDLVTIAEKLNIEKQADLVEEIAFENLKVKEPIIYTEEEVKQLFIDRAKEFSPASKAFGDFLLKQDLDWLEKNRKK
jgi:hypothetical protein